MVKDYDEAGNEICCPRCNAIAIYKNGKIKTGKQRYLCMICGRQFILSDKRLKIVNRPACPACGRLMHFYRRGDGVMRFRCSCYPECKTYAKISIKKEIKNELLHA